jgi:hypothetical protein
MIVDFRRCPSLALSSSFSLLSLVGLLECKEPSGSRASNRLDFDGPQGEPLLY